jgi:hypothetical protein
MFGEVLCWHARIIRLQWTNASAARSASSPPSPGIWLTGTSGASRSTATSATPVRVAPGSAVISPTPVPSEFTRYAFHLLLGVRKHGLIVGRFLDLVG